MRKFSVIVPVYNVENQLSNCSNSLLECPHVSNVTIVISVESCSYLNFFKNY